MQDVDRGRRKGNHRSLLNRVAVGEGQVFAGRTTQTLAEGTIVHSFRFSDFSFAPSVRFAEPNVEMKHRFIDFGTRNVTCKSL
jgi:hypothetical protein